MMEALKASDPLALGTLFVAILTTLGSLWSIWNNRRKGLKEADVADVQLTLEQLKWSHSVKDTIIKQLQEENSRLIAENKRLKSE